MGTNLLPPTVTRGDVFALPEDDYLDYNLTVDLGTEPSTKAAPTELPTTPLPVQPTPESEPGPEETLTETPMEEVPSTTADGLGERDPEEEPEELCSGKPFNAFTDLKNGSLYAFRGTSGTFLRHMGHAVVLSPHAGGHAAAPTSPLPPGKYFYELDETSVRPGYPKLISDVWGIEGPIDAAFTRINCQGKTYLFKVGRSPAAGLGVLLGQLAQPPTYPVPTLTPPCANTHSGCQISLNSCACLGPQAATTSPRGFSASTCSPGQTLTWGMLHPAP